MSDENNSVETKIFQQENAKPYRFFLKNTRGESSVTLTMVWVSFCLVSLLYVLNAFDSIHGIKLKNFDTTATGVYFSSILAVYAARKFTDKEK